jgi:hypothetical protein
MPVSALDDFEVQERPVLQVDVSQRAILSRREKIKRLTLERRKKENLRNAA